jgi:alkane 1-monooxygenase
MAMQTEAVSAAPALRPLRAWMLHLWAFVLPLVNATFLLTGPHSWWAALLWTTPIWLLVLMDNGSKPDRRQPTADTPNWPFDLQVYALTAIQVMNHVLLGVMASKIAVWPLAELGTAFANLVAVIIVSGTTAGYSGIVVAHEWIHRRSRHQFFLGRMLLGLVLYEHFATEHVRGHHPRIGTRQDPATARFGETLREFIRRTIPAQFKSAWRLEKVRLGDESGKLTLSQWLQHRVLQGLVAEVLLLVAYGWFFGIVAVVFFFMQARASIVLLETVNYIEHWGLTRQGKKVTGLDSWDTENYFTLYTLVGLSRHADHHAQASRPFQKLRHFQESPKMPLGYYGTILTAMFKNESYRAYATEELRRRQLGPFRQSDAPAPADAPVAAE